MANGQKGALFVTDKKVLGENRRELILSWLKSHPQPITGSELASRTNVSRQVIVGDITLLKAKGEPIMATSQGYLYLPKQTESSLLFRTLACSHSPNQTEDELNLLVDHGLTVQDVKIEHPIYGDLSASIMVSNRQEVKQFMEKVRSTNASFLSELTNGIHLHTVSARSEEALNKAEEAMRNGGFLIEYK